MPLFEYRCKDCGHEFEELVFGNKAVPCPKCESQNTEKKISAFMAGGSSGSKSSSCTNFT